MRRRPLVWLAAGLFLIMAAALLMLLVDGNRPSPVTANVKMPRHMDSDTWKRVEARRIPVFVQAQPNNEQPADAGTRRFQADPLLALMPQHVQKAAIVMEANALMNSPVGQMLLACLSANDRGNEFAKLQDELGLKIDRDIDRVAMIDDTLVVSGFFQNAKWDEKFVSFPKEEIGDQGAMWKKPNGGVIVQWDKRLLFQAKDANTAHDLIGRLAQQSEPVEHPVLSESQTYGEIYGVVGSEAFAALFGNEIPELKERIKGFADRVELHVDASHDVGMVADVQGQPGVAGGDDLGKSLGGVLAMGRMKARLDGDTKLADLLDLARVQLNETGFRTELAVPLELVKSWLGPCANGVPDAGVQKND